jgi:hypothetical protein
MVRIDATLTKTIATGNGNLGCKALYRQTPSSGDRSAINPLNTSREHVVFDLQNLAGVRADQ